MSEHARRSGATDLTTTVLHALRSELALHRIDRRPHPLLGAADPRAAAAARRPELETPLASQLAASYGTLADEVVASRPLEPLADGVTEVAAQVLYAHAREWALRRDSYTVCARVETLLAS